MPGTSVDVPVLLILFNRPNHVRQLLDRLRAGQPKSLYVAVDGVRMGHPTDMVRVAECIATLDEIDWPCTVHRLIRNQNLGCKLAVSSAIDWFFQQVPEGIILEDDCLPDPTFFSFCADLLTRYRSDERVMHISGANLYQGRTWGDASYFFSPIPHIWGWATWRRAWQHYDVQMTGYPDFEQSGGIERTVPDQDSVHYWKRALSATFGGTINTWDYQWVYAIWRKGGLCITPNHNLITNIGFGKDATHTITVSPFANMPTKALPAITHPAGRNIDTAALTYIVRSLYVTPSWFMRKLTRLKQLLS